MNNAILIIFGALTLAVVVINGYNIMHKAPREVVGRLECVGKVEHPPIEFEVLP